MRNIAINNLTKSYGSQKAGDNQDPTGSFVIKSNQNDAYFNSDSTGLFRKLVLDFKELK